MLPSAMPATNRNAGPRATKRAYPRHQSQPGATSTTPITQNEGGCQQAPRLPRITKVEALLHREAFNTEDFFLHTQDFTQRSHSSEELFHINVLELLHTKAVTQRRLYTESFTHRHTKKSLHKEFFTHGFFYTQKLLHREVFAQRRLYTK